MRNGVKFMHVRTEKNGAVTLAYKRLDEDSDLWLFGAAFCAPTDMFNRVRGRDIALGRLRERVGREEGNGKPLQMPGTTSLYNGQQPHRSEDLIGRVLSDLTAKPYKGLDSEGEWKIWYPQFLYAVERGDVIRRKKS